MDWFKNSKTKAMFSAIKDALLEVLRGNLSRPESVENEETNEILNIIGDIADKFSSEAHERETALKTKREYENLLKENIRVAEEVSSAQALLLSHISREIRTPMNSIIGFSELALDDVIPPNTREYLNKIIDSSDWLLHTIDDIIDVAKIESGKIELESVPFDLRKVFENCKASAMLSAKKKGAELYCYAEPTVGRKMVGDPVRLRQVLLNLLSAALNFTAGGSVKLLAYITSMGENCCAVCFEVKGADFNNKQAGMVFELFKQNGAKSIKDIKKHEYVGTGLIIAKNIIELMGGKLEMESVSGEGGGFSFELQFETIEAPVDMPEEVKSRETEIKKPLFSGEVLVCEDNLMNQQVVCEHLSRVGLKFDLAQNGKEGIDHVVRRMERGERPFDLIFMDIHMPVMDGVEAASYIFKLETGTPIVAMTANIMFSDRARCQTSGMRDFIGKPFTAQELWRCLLKYINPIGIDDVDETGGESGFDEKFNMRLRSDFIKGNSEGIKAIVSAINKGDLKSAHRLAHSLKTDASIIGMDDLSEAAASVEDRLKDGINYVTEDMLVSLEKELDSAIDKLNIVLGHAEGSSEQSAENLSREEIKKLIKNIEPLIKSGNPECLRFIGGLRAIKGSEKLIEQMNDFDFAQAELTLEVLKKELE
ncbi:MAG: response regulator [Eubacterium sp.]|nr:response regulator [Eubacterium sp.]